MRKEPGDAIVAEWYDLFLDLWTQRNRLEWASRDVLERLWREHGGDAVPSEDPSVIVTGLLLRVRGEFLDLHRAARRPGELPHASVHLLRERAQEIHDRWDAIFRQALFTGGKKDRNAGAESA